MLSKESRHALTTLVRLWHLTGRRSVLTGDVAQELIDAGMVEGSTFCESFSAYRPTPLGIMVITKENADA